MTERGSTRHSARVDDELEGEVESLVRGAPVEARVEEWRQMEPAAEGEPNPDGITTVDDVELRSLLAVSLRPSAFPGDRARLLEVAAEEHAEDRVLEWLASLPEAREFDTVQSVWEALGGGHETRDAPVITRAEPVESPSPSIETGPRTEPTGPPHAEESAPAQSPPEAADSPSLVGRVVSIAFAGVSIGVGVAVEAMRCIRRRI
ncbi:MAG: hypothetical protein QOE62_2469 [Actinomycetota bacterium]|jgi:hypothetical protein|nr:hypothetical protein [Actinomycetota bacterium]